MSNTLHRTLTHHRDITRDTALSALNAFIDGELAVNEQPAMFTHLASCEDCRQQLEGVMNFRRISRGENLVVSPALDAALFKRIQKHKVMMRRIDRAEDRRPLWNARASLSIRTTVITAILLFLTGLLMPAQNQSDYARLGYVTGEDELIEFADLELGEGNTSTLYVFFPGLTIEADKEELIDSESP